MLYNMNLGSMLLGCLMKQPSLLSLPQYPLCRDDFSPVEFHKAMYVVILNLAKEGVQEITEIEVENFVKNYPIQMEIFQDNDYMEYIHTVKDLCTLSNYGHYYDTIRKFSLLRELKAQGYDIAPYYDELQDEEVQRAQFNKLTIQDILNDVEIKSAKLRNKYDVKYVRDEIKAGEDTEALIEMFKEKPSMGALLQSGYLTTIWNGWSRGHLLLRAGGSGSGKTRCSIADLCNVGMLKTWDDKVEDFLINPNYQGPTLFIATEQDIRTEVEPMFLSAVSGVEYRRIKNGMITKEEEARVKKAGEIISQSNLTITSMPNFTSKGLERKIKEQVEVNGIAYMVFDYMEIQGDLSAEFKSLSAVVPRQDLVLLNLASDLKRYCEDYNIGMLTGMQLSEGWKDTRFVDESYLAGSKASKNKIDNGSIIVPTTYLKREIKELEPFFNRRGIGNKRIPLPNICEYIFKGRYSIYGDRRLKVWSYFDRGTFRRYDYFVTDDTNAIQKDIKPTKYKETTDEEEKK